MSEENIEKWDKVFSDGRALKYPDVTLTHLIHRYVLSDKNIKKCISVGCGNGNNELMIARTGLQVVCTDSSKAAIDTLLKLAGEEGLQDRVEGYVLPMHDMSRFKDNSFDLAVHWGALHYERSERGYKSLSECHRILRKGGLFIGEVDSTYSSGFRYTVAQVEKGTIVTGPGIIEWREGIEVHPYSREELEEQLAPFSEFKLGHRVNGWLGRLDVQIAQWFFVAKK